MNVHVKGILRGEAALINMALAAGLVAIAVAVAITLSRAPLRVAKGRSVPPEKVLVETTTDGGACQYNELMPRDTSAIRLGLFSASSPAVTVKVFAGSRLITSGALAAGWAGEGATVPVAKISRSVSPVEVCFHLDSVTGDTEMLGRAVRPAEATVARGRRLPGRISIEYLQPGHSSWWSLAGSVARRLGLGRAASGIWNALLVMVLVVMVLALSSWLVARDLCRRVTHGVPVERAVASDPAVNAKTGETGAAGPNAARPSDAGPNAARPRPSPRRTASRGGRRQEGARRGTAPTAVRSTVGSRSFTRRTPITRERNSRSRQTAPAGSGLVVGSMRALRRIPVTAWVCALVACLNAVCWSVISPPFQVPDEPSHFAYVQHLAETGSLPTNGGEDFPSIEEVALSDLKYAEVLEHPAVGTISSEAQQRKLEHDLAIPYQRTGSGAAGVAATEPPLYYALETIPYDLESAGTILDRLAMMRLLSALMGGLTALFVFLFLREALPAVPWAWTVGGLAVALTPLLGVMSGTVNPDALLFAISAALFYCLARGFHRGLTPPLAVAIGAVFAVGYLTKLNFLGLLPGALLGLFVLCAREARTSRPTAYRLLALALSVAAGPILLYIVVNVASGRSAVGSLASAVTLNERRGSIFHELSYVWQFYLPRLPGMTSYFNGFPTTRVYWFDGLVGHYGWLDTAFPGLVYNLALIPAGLIAVLFTGALVRSRYLLRSRLVEGSVYLVMSLGVLLVVGAADYFDKLPGEYAEPRYLLPMLALWGGVLALAARGVGRRWGPIAGVLIIILAMAHDVFSQLLVISRYYG